VSPWFVFYAATRFHESSFVFFFAAYSLGTRGLCHFGSRPFCGRRRRRHGADLTKETYITTRSPSPRLRRARGGTLTVLHARFGAARSNDTQRPAESDRLCVGGDPLFYTVFLCSLVVAHRPASAFRVAQHRHEWKYRPEKNVVMSSCMLPTNARGARPRRAVGPRHESSGHTCVWNHPLGALRIRRYSIVRLKTPWFLI